MNRQAGLCGFTGDGVAHGGPAAWVEMACVHGHVETGWGCERHLAVARDRVNRSGSVRCGRCHHVCPLALRVPATGETAGVQPWPGKAGLWRGGAIAAEGETAGG